MWLRMYLMLLQNPSCLADVASDDSINTWPPRMMKNGISWYTTGKIV